MMVAETWFACETSLLFVRVLDVDPCWTRLLLNAFADGSAATSRPSRPGCLKTVTLREVRLTIGLRTLMA
jgi:hypothetical protein